MVSAVRAGLALTAQAAPAAPVDLAVVAGAAAVAVAAEARAALVALAVARAHNRTMSVRTRRCREPNNGPRAVSSRPVLILGKVTLQGDRRVFKLEAGPEAFVS